VKCCLVTPYPPERCGIAIYSSKFADRLALFLDLVVIGNRDLDRMVESIGRIRVVRSWKRNSLAYILEIVRRVAQQAPHVVHIQHEYLAYGRRKYGLLFPVLLAILRLFGRPVVLTMHSVVRRDRLTAEFFLTHQAGGRFAESKRSVMIILTRLVVRISSAVIVHNEAMKIVLTNDYDLKGDKVFVIPHGTDTYSVEERSSGSKWHVGLSGKRIVLFFGFIVPGKGLEILLRSFSRVMNKIPDAFLMIAGGYHPRLRSEFPEYIGTIERLIDELGLQGNVVFENRFFAADELNRHISAADIVVFPYVDDSILGASGALASCAGMGKAVVATNLPRFSSDIRNRYDGILVRPSDEDELASAVVKLLEDEKLRTRIGQNLRREAFKRDWTKIASMTYELYLKTIAGTRRNSSL